MRAFPLVSSCFLILFLLLHLCFIHPAEADKWNTLQLMDSSLTDGEDTIFLTATLSLTTQRIHLTQDILRVYLRSPWIPNISYITILGYTSTGVRCIDQKILNYKLRDDIVLPYQNLHPNDIPINTSDILLFIRVHLFDPILVNPFSLEVFVEYQFQNRDKLEDKMDIERFWSETFTNVYWTTPCKDQKCHEMGGFSLYLEEFTLPTRDELSTKLSHAKQGLVDLHATLQNKTLALAHGEATSSDFAEWDEYYQHALRTWQRNVEAITMLTQHIASLPQPALRNDTTPTTPANDITTTTSNSPQNTKLSADIPTDLFDIDLEANTARTTDDRQYALLVNTSPNVAFINVPDTPTDACTLNYVPVKVVRFDTASPGVPTRKMIILLTTNIININQLQTFSISCPNINIQYQGFAKDYVLTLSSGLYHPKEQKYSVHSTYTGGYQYKPYVRPVDVAFKPGFYDAQGNTVIQGYMYYGNDHAPLKTDRFLLCGLDEASMVSFTVQQKITNQQGDAVWVSREIDDTKGPLTAYSTQDPFDPSLSWQELMVLDPNGERSPLQSVPQIERICVGVSPYKGFTKLTPGFYHFTMSLLLTLNPNAKRWADSLGDVVYRDLFYIAVGEFTQSGVGLFNWRYRGQLTLNQQPASNNNTTTNNNALSSLSLSSSSPSTLLLPTTPTTTTTTAITTHSLHHSVQQQYAQEQAQQHESQQLSRLYNNIFSSPLIYMPYNKTNPQHASQPHLQQFYREYPFNVQFPRIIVNLNLTKNPSAFRTLRLAQIDFVALGALSLLPTTWSSTLNFPHFYNNPALKNVTVDVKCSMLLRSFWFTADFNEYVKQYPDDVADALQDSGYWHTITLKHTSSALTLDTNDYLEAIGLPRQSDLQAYGYTRLILDCSQSVRLVAINLHTFNQTSQFGVHFFKQQEVYIVNDSVKEQKKEQQREQQQQQEERRQQQQQQGYHLNYAEEHLESVNRLNYYTYTTAMPTVLNTEAAPHWSLSWYVPWYYLSWAGVLIAAIIGLSILLTLLIIITIIRYGHQRRARHLAKERAAQDKAQNKINTGDENGGDYIQLGDDYDNTYTTSHTNNNTIPTITTTVPISVTNNNNNNTPASPHPNIEFQQPRGGAPHAASINNNNHNGTHPQQQQPPPHAKQTNNPVAKKLKSNYGDFF